MQSKSILLVEDNDGEAELLAKALQKSGITAKVTRARDGAEALDILRRTEENGDDPPSVVFLDLDLPKLHGLEVLRRIRSQERMRMLPVVVLSGSKREVDIATASMLGANNYLTKHTNFSEFSQAVGLLATYWLSVNAPWAAAQSHGSASARDDWSFVR